MKKKSFIIVFMLMCLLYLVSIVLSKDKGQVFVKPMQGEHVQTLANLCNWSYWMRNDGWSGINPFTENGGGIYPRGTTNVIFEDGLVWGGVIPEDSTNFPGNPGGAVWRVGGNTYVVGTQEGHIATAGTPTSPPVPYDANLAYIYRIRRDFHYNPPAADAFNPNPSVVRDAAEINDITTSAVTVSDQQAIIDEYEWAWENWPVEFGAPYYDVNGNGQYDPGVEMDLNGDGVITVGEIEEPGIAGADQVIWYAINDVNAGNTEALYGSEPIGVECQTTIWTYNQPSSALGQVIFKKYLLINKSGFPVHDMYMAQWCDPDVGDYTDDLVGCDTTINMGFAYSGNKTDAEFSKFGLPPAAVGYDFFEGPTVYTGVMSDTAIFGLEYRAGYKNLPQISFGYFAAGSAISDPDLGSYDGTEQWYNLLRGFIPDLDPNNPKDFVHGFGPLAGEPTKFPVDGDPVTRTGDVDGLGTNLPPGDRRMSLSSGPFEMQTWEDANGTGLADFGDPGVQEMVVGIVGGIVAVEGGDNRNAVAQMKLNDGFAQFVYDNLFQAIPQPPAPPKVKFTPTEDAIFLDWGYDKDAIAETEKNLPLGYKFEGYNVYQLPTISSSIEQGTRVATFDRKDNGNLITQLLGYRFVPSYGGILQVPIQNGTNSGIQRHFTIEKDYINDTPLFPGNKYYFAVTAYNAKDENGDGIADTDVLDRNLDQGLESAVQILEVTPQPPTPGTRYPNAPGSSLDITVNSLSTGSVTATVVNPLDLTGDSYEVGFNDSPAHYILGDSTFDTTGVWTGFDTLGAWYEWYLKNTTTDSTIITSSTTLDGWMGDNEDYNVQGFFVQVYGPKALGLAGYTATGTRWITGVNFGLPQFFGGLGTGADFFGSSLGAADLVPIKIEFQDEASVAAEGYWTKGAVYRRDNGYAYEGMGDLPMRAWDVLNPANPRQLNICFVEDASDGNTNSIWDLGGPSAARPDLGGREYLFFMDSDYSPDPDPFYSTHNILTDGGDFDVLYAMGAQLRGSHPYLEAEFTMNVLANIPSIPGDTYTFSTQTVVSGNKSLAAKEVDKINVFPNPYYGTNPSEANRFERFVTFTHLPRRVTVRIFSLSGTQVRKLTEADKTNAADQFLRWDLKNESNLPVASGIYVAHIDMPDLGKEKVLKVFIIQRAEILEFY